MTGDSEEPLEKSTAAKLLTEIKEEFTRRQEFRKEQDERADKTMTMSSTIATLLIGLGAFLVSYLLKSSSPLFFVEVSILCIGIILGAGAIIFFLLAHQVRESIFARSSNDLNRFLQKTIKITPLHTPLDVYLNSIEAYINALDALSIRIRRKSWYLMMGQMTGWRYFFICSFFN